MVAGRQTRAQSLHPDLQVGRQTETLGLVEASETSEPTSLTHLEQDHTLLSFLNSLLTENHACKYMGLW